MYESVDEGRLVRVKEGGKVLSQTQTKRAPLRLARVNFLNPGSYRLRLSWECECQKSQRLE